MKKAAIPFGLCPLLMFFVPLGKVSGLNAVWIAAFMWEYYFFFTLYMIPHNALIPELIRDGPLRVNAYTVSSFFFVTGSALGYVLAVLVVTEGQRKLQNRNVPAPFKGLPVTLLYIGVLALAIYGFTGHMQSF